MKTIELSAALASAPVQENLKNFAGLDAQNALGLMTPERLAAVAGELNHTLGGTFYTNIVIGKVGDFENPIKVAEETMAILPHKRVAFICLHTYAGVRIVRGLIYEGHDHGFFYIEEWNGNHCVVVLDKGEFKRKEQK